jgi:hypothetical protein
VSKPSDQEINASLDKCADAENEGTTQWPGMTYEQGVRAGIEWVLGNTTDNPVADE